MSYDSVSVPLAANDNYSIPNNTPGVRSDDRVLFDVKTKASLEAPGWGRTVPTNVECHKEWQRWRRPLKVAACLMSSATTNRHSNGHNYYLAVLAR